MKSFNEENLYDVIIVGAGLSGLSAAYNLRNKCPSLKILIIEGKDRVGGRTETVELNCSKDGKKAKFDVGGQWVTDTQANVTKLIKEFNIETYHQFDEGKKVLECDGKLETFDSSIFTPTKSNLNLLSLIFNKMKINRDSKLVNTLKPFENQEMANFLNKINFDQYFDGNFLSKRARSIFNIGIRCLHGLEASQINSLFGLLYISSAGSYEVLALSEKGCAQEKRINGGSQQISQRLLDDFISKSSQNNGIIKLNTAMIEVIQDDLDLVHLITEDTDTNSIKTYQAKKIISSIPINQYSNVEFQPELPFFKRNLFRFMQMGNLIKFIVTYKTPFWRLKGFSGEVLSDGSIFDSKVENQPTFGPINILYDGTTNENDAAIVGFIAANAVVEWIDQSPEYRQTEIIKCLVRYFGDEANDFIDFYEKIWNNEKYIGGAPTLNVSAGGVMEDYVRATREPFLNVHFCGTESATVWQGYMDGAIESGERAANEVLYQMFKDEKEVSYEYEKTYYYQCEKANNIPVKHSFDLWPWINYFILTFITFAFIVFFLSGIDSIFKFFE